MTRVVRILARLNTGGPTIHTVLLTRDLDPRRFQSRLVTGVVDPSEGDMSYYAASHGVEAVVIPELGRRVGVRRLAVAFVRLCGVIARERPHIIHTHTATAGGLGRVAGVLYNMAARVRGWPRAKLVHTFHGHVFHGYFSPWRSRLMVWIERVLARVTDRVLTVSEGVRDDLVERYRICPADRVTVVPLGLDFAWLGSLERGRGVWRAKYAIPHDAILIGMVGRLATVKNHDLFLDGVARLGRKDVYAVVIGDGTRRPELEAKIVAEGLADRVFLTGWEPDHANIYADLDIVCLTSANEGTPVALIEAMAAARPFIATDVGGVRDLVSGAVGADEQGYAVFANGILIRPGDTISLTAALAFLADRPEVRAAMGAAGQQQAVERFSAERLVRDMEQVYDALLERGEKGVGCER